MGIILASPMDIVFNTASGRPASALASNVRQTRAGNTAPRQGTFPIPLQHDRRDATTIPPNAATIPPIPPCLLQTCPCRGVILY